MFYRKLKSPFLGWQLDFHCPRVVNVSDRIGEADDNTATLRKMVFKVVKKCGITKKCCVIGLIDTVCFGRKEAEIVRKYESSL